MCSSTPKPCELGFHGSRKDADQEPPVSALTTTQVFLVLEGEARVEIKDGPVLELEAGDVACLPKGAVTTWHLTLPFKGMWVLAG